MVARLSSLLSCWAADADAPQKKLNKHVNDLPGAVSRRFVNLTQSRREASFDIAAPEALSHSDLASRHNHSNQGLLVLASCPPSAGKRHANRSMDRVLLVYCNAAAARALGASQALVTDGDHTSICDSVLQFLETSEPLLLRDLRAHLRRVAAAEPAGALTVQLSATQYYPPTVLQGPSLNPSNSTTATVSTSTTHLLADGEATSIINTNPNNTYNNNIDDTTSIDRSISGSTQQTGRAAVSRGVNGYPPATSSSSPRELGSRNWQHALVQPVAFLATLPLVAAAKKEKSDSARAGAFASSVKALRRLGALSWRAASHTTCGPAKGGKTFRVRPYMYGNEGRSGIGAGDAGDRGAVQGPAESWPAVRVWFKSDRTETEATMAVTGTLTATRGTARSPPSGGGGMLHWKPESWTCTAGGAAAAAANVAPADELLFPDRTPVAAASTAVAVLAGTAAAVITGGGDVGAAAAAANTGGSAVMTADGARQVQRPTPSLLAALQSRCSAVQSSSVRRPDATGRLHCGRPSTAAVLTGPGVAEAAAVCTRPAAAVEVEVEAAVDPRSIRLREGMVLAGLTPVITALTADGRAVVYQNQMSLCYYGTRTWGRNVGYLGGHVLMGAATLTAERGGGVDCDEEVEGCTSGIAEDGVLAELFCLEPVKMGRMLTEVCVEGRVWKGIVQVPASCHPGLPALALQQQQQQQQLTKANTSGTSNYPSCTFSAAATATTASQTAAPDPTITSTDPAILTRLLSGEFPAASSQGYTSPRLLRAAPAVPIHLSASEDTVAHPAASSAPGSLLQNAGRLQLAARGSSSGAESGGVDTAAYPDAGAGALHGGVGGGSRLAPTAAVAAAAAAASGGSARVAHMGRGGGGGAAGQTQDSVAYEVLSPGLLPAATLSIPGFDAVTQADGSRHWRITSSYADLDPLATSTWGLLLGAPEPQAQPLATGRNLDRAVTCGHSSGAFSAALTWRPNTTTGGLSASARCAFPSARQKPSQGPDPGKSQTQTLLLPTSTNQAAINVRGISSATLKAPRSPERCTAEVVPGQLGSGSGPSACHGCTARWRRSSDCYSQVPYMPFLMPSPGLPSPAAGLQHSRKAATAMSPARLGPSGTHAGSSDGDNGGGGDGTTAPPDSAASELVSRAASLYNLGLFGPGRPASLVGPKSSQRHHHHLQGIGELRPLGRSASHTVPHVLAFASSLRHTPCAVQQALKASVVGSGYSFCSLPVREEATCPAAAAAAAAAATTCGASTGTCNDFAVTSDTGSKYPFRQTSPRLEAHPECSVALNIAASRPASGGSNHLTEASIGPTAESIADANDSGENASGDSGDATAANLVLRVSTLELDGATHCLLTGGGIGGGGDDGCGNSGGGDGGGGSGDVSESERHLLPGGGMRCPGGGCSGGGGGTAVGYCWHEVCASRTTDPVTGQCVILLTQVDVSAKVEAERHLAFVTEAEHRLLEQIFPRHVLAYMTEEGGSWAAAGDPGTGPGGGCGGSRNGPVVRDINKLATSHQEVTLLFADIEGFTPMCKVLEPRVIMAFLNDLFTRFDQRLDEFGVYKVETIGDCYFVAGGLIHEDEQGMPAVRARESNADPLHAEKVLQFAKAMLSAASQVTLPTTGCPVRVRIGIHSGPVVSGVVGQRMPRFCLFGDTVNTASRMESTGVAGCIHASEAARRLLVNEAWVPTGGIEVKGKGLMNTYLWAPPAQVVRHAGA